MNGPTKTPPPLIMSDTIIDRTAIETLRSLGEGDDEFLREIIGIYLQDTPERLAELRTRNGENDRVAFVRAAHTIKGSSGNVGANEVRTLAETLEQLATRTPLAELATHVAELEAAYARARTELEKLIA